MSIQNGYIYNFFPDGSCISGALTLGASSVSVTLPVGIENVILAATGNCHFRFSIGPASAVITDPLIGAQFGPIVVKLPAGNTAYTLSVIQDAGATGILSYAKVAEA